MFSRYDDILERVAGPPLWWLNGMPRYSPFHPKDAGVHAREVALVHTECQQCRTRYDVAVQPEMFGSLRDEIAYAGETNYGDPPNACPAKMLHAGATMSANQIVVLELWVREGRPIPKWVRHPEWERPLTDASLIGLASPQPVWRRIHASERKQDWMTAKNNGNFTEMVGILTEFGCERAREVAHMFDLERRHGLRMREFFAKAKTLREERFGEEKKAEE